MKRTSTFFKSLLLFLFFISMRNVSAQTYNAIAVTDTLSSDNIFVPNTFTPNNDHINDFFQVKGAGLNNSDFEIGIYDRWGRCVYQSQNSNSGWDGKVGADDAPEDVYVYKIRITRYHREVIKLGKITLAR